MKLTDNQMCILALIILEQEDIFRENKKLFLSNYNSFCLELDLCLKEQGYEYDWDNQDDDGSERDDAQKYN